MKRFATIGTAFLTLFLQLAPLACEAGETAPQVKAIGAVLMDYKTGRVLWGKNEHTPMAMASTTKIMTAALALESGKLEETVTVSKRAASAPEVKMGLSTGEKVKMNELLYALMLESQNDAAVAIAEGISGSVEEFCALMTAKASELGAKNTVFETPNGLDKGDHHSTAYDMALITRYALSKPEFMKLINTKSISFSSDRRSYVFNNKNRLLTEYQGANGVKTGFTGKAGHCFVGAAQRGEMELISVVLASGWGRVGKEGKWSDTKALLNYGFANFKYVDLVQAGKVAGEIPITRSKTGKVRFCFNEALTLPLNEQELQSVQVSVKVPDSIKAPVKTGDQVGTAEVSIGGMAVKAIPLTAADDALRHDFKTSLEKVIDSWLKLGSDHEIEIILPEFLSES
ncbi:MAG: D-alanyl-D-alanine carboxypeptidase [Clostridiales bacterium]|jgi:D-alanyl-D-alanine carboxypeptidase (penicillin-binding protein 5/6)|nr:D-alanyl-D-alanine carboxypeptidase [Clostridiales bacterium]